MDLPAEAQRLRLDVLAVGCSRALVEAKVPHVLLKGPSTANWLYDPPRRYRDVDLLVPRSRLPDAVACLARTGLARANAGIAGEEAEHSLLLIGATGFEVDLHFSLPAVAPRADLVWDVLGGRTETLMLDVGGVPVLDEPARCVVLALHALANAAHPGQPREDLLRARQQAKPASWVEAAVLARRLDVEPLFDAGLGLIEAGHGTRSPRARLYVDAAPAAAHGLLRLSEVRRRELPRRLARELIPTSGFMIRADPDAGSGGAVSLARAHLRRWRRLAVQLPKAVQAWRRARREGRP